MNHGKGSRTEGAAGRVILSDSRTEMIVSFFRVTEGCAGGHVQWGPGISWGEQCSIPLHMVNLTQCSEAPPPPSSRITAISTESTASKLPTYAPPLPHPMKVEQTDRDVEVTTISSSIFANCPSLSSLSPSVSVEPGDIKEEILLTKAKAPRRRAVMA